MEFEIQSPSQFFETLAASGQPDHGQGVADAAGWVGNPVYRAQEAARVLNRHFATDQGADVTYEGKNMYENTFMDRVLKPLWHVCSPEHLLLCTGTVT